MSYAMLRTCSECGAQNRVPARHLADTGKCGSCKAELPPVSEPIDADAASFQEIIAAAKVPVLTDFWAEWCGPCRMAAPEVKALAREMAGKALVLKVDTEAYPQLAAQYRVQAIPNFILFRNGQVAGQRSGLAPRNEMKRWLESV